MKLVRLYLDNFKGVKSPTIVDLENDASILKGPNGFGKTTIFDAIELCITGEIYRTSVFKSVTDDYQNYTDAFYRNVKNRDTVIHLLIEGKDGRRFTIVKVLPANSTGRVDELRNTIRYKAAEWGLLRTYIVDEESFASSSADLSNKRDQGDVEEALIGTRGNLTSLYRLFSYLQQAENTFYLKKSEKQRKTELDYLFGTDPEAETKKKLADRHSLLTKLESTLRGRITALGSINNESESVDYVKLIARDDLKFDVEKPYRGIEVEQLNEKHSEFRESINEVETFLQSFDPNVYANYKIRQDIFQLAKNDSFLDYTVLHKLLEDDVYQELSDLASVKKSLTSDSFLNYFILQKFLDQQTLDTYIENTKFYNQFYEYRKSDDKPVSIDEKLERILSWDEGIEPKLLKAAEKFSEDIEKISERLSSTESALSDLVELRDGLSKAFSKIPNTHSEEGNCECPYCGFDWKNIDTLRDAAQQKSEKFQKQLEGETKTLTDLKTSIEKDLLKTVDEYADQYLSAKVSDFNFLNLLLRIKRGSADNQYAPIIELLKKRVPQTEKLIWDTRANTEKFTSDTAQLRDFSNSDFIDENVFERITRQKGLKYDDAMQFLEKRGIKFFQAWETKTVGSEAALTATIDGLRTILVDAAQSIEIDDEKLGGNLMYMFKDYFQESSEKLSEAKIKVKQKKAYIEAEYQKNRRAAYRVLAERHKKLKKVLGVTKEAKQKYENLLRDYKGEMIDKIRLPFYVYTAKILQNYQQGMGVFVASSGNVADSIRFVTESESNHDIVHHLSSGQLAVVSIAFTLAINKVYGNSSLGLIAIDDPVYELDGLNVHSFVELLRRSFLGEYQLVLSTHDNDSALYMKYRFEKMPDIDVAVIDVQETFFKQPTS
jgi:exonuclease SbcC